MKKEGILFSLDEKKSNGSKVAFSIYGIIFTYLRTASGIMEFSTFIPPNAYNPSKQLREAAKEFAEAYFKKHSVEQARLSI